MSIPLGFVNRAVNKLFVFKDRLVTVVEIVNDEEFVESYRGIRNLGYLLTYEDKGIPKIIIMESKEGEFVSICIRGFIDILRFMNRQPFLKDDELYLKIKEAVEEEMNSVPPLERVETEEPPRDPIVYRPENSGVPVAFFSLIVKVSSINNKYKGGFDKFIEDTTTNSSGGIWYWECDGRLLSTISMAGNEMEDIIALLIQNGLQCKSLPPDFYLTEVRPSMVEENDSMYHYCYTFDDGQIEYFEQGGSFFARLKSGEA